MAFSQARAIVYNSEMKMIAILGTVATYHGLLLFSCWGLILIKGRKKRNREIISLMGG
jgi:hypothetical protein